MLRVNILSVERYFGKKRFWFVLQALWSGSSGVCWSNQADVASDPPFVSGVRQVSVDWADQALVRDVGKIPELRTVFRNVIVELCLFNHFIHHSFIQNTIDNTGLFEFEASHFVL